MNLNGKLDINPKMKTVITVILATVLVILVWFGAYQKGKNTGIKSGTAVGTALGSKQGLMEGIQQGHEDALTAENTKVVLAQEFQTAGKLQVLSAGVTARNFQTLGDAYKAIQILKGEIVFTVDLQSAMIVATESSAVILIDTPQAKFYLDEEATKMIAEAHNRTFLSMNEKDGILAQLNSRAKIVEEIEKYIDGYGALMRTANKIAIEQTKNLADAACGGKKEIIVAFKGE